MALTMHKHNAWRHSTLAAAPRDVHGSLQSGPHALIGMGSGIRSDLGCGNVPHAPPRHEACMGRQPLRPHHKRMTPGAIEAGDIHVRLRARSSPPGSSRLHVATTPRDIDIYSWQCLVLVGRAGRARRRTARRMWQIGTRPLCCKLLSSPPVSDPRKMNQRLTTSGVGGETHVGVSQSNHRATPLRRRKRREEAIFTGVNRHFFALFGNDSSGLRPKKSMNRRPSLGKRKDD
jgi:hypothetical protein